jgi:hypothetical protein
LEIERLVGHEPLEPSVLFLEGLEAAGLVDLEAAVLSPPAVEGGLRDPVPAAELPGL